MQVAPELKVVKMTSLEESNLYSEIKGRTYRVVGGRLGSNQSASGTRLGYLYHQVWSWV